MRSLSLMEWNSNTPSEWDWENLAAYSGREIEVPEHVQLSSYKTEGNVLVENGSIYSSGSGSFSSSAFGHGSLYKSSFSASAGSSSKEITKKFGEMDYFPKDSIEKEEFSWSGKNHPNIAEPIIGLKLGTQTYCKDMCAASTTKTTSFSVIPASSSPTMKRSRASYQSSQVPCCQVEGCNLNLALAKDYHRRHRICESHSKSPKVILAGMERRFCQQCSRFHDLSEFDDKKRSCRRRLSVHNARRRRPQPEDIQFSSTQVSSSICDRRPQMNFLVNRVPIPVPNPTWESACDYEDTLRGESFFLAKDGGVDRELHLPSDVMPSGISALHVGSDRASSFQGVTPLFVNHGLQASTVTSNSLFAPELRCAFSLLSTSSWSLNEPEPPTSLDRMVHGNSVSLDQPRMPSIIENWELASSDYAQVKETPHESECFYSHHIS